jgi:hypothetical protein
VSVADQPSGRGRGCLIAVAASLATLAFVCVGGIVFLVALGESVQRAQVDRISEAQVAAATKADAQAEHARIGQQLVVGHEKCSGEYGYSTATGRVTNGSSYTVQFVKLEARFYDRKGQVIDISSTYAVGSEYLRPGESAEFRASSTADGVSRCGADLVDFRVVQ